MGLDMYAYITKEEFEGETDFEIEKADEIAYWRKHPDLNGWMEELYYRKGGMASSFNCANVELNLEDLDILQELVQKNMLPKTTGSQLGIRPADRKKHDLQFVRRARGAIQDGYRVFYSSWW